MTGEIVSDAITVWNRHSGVHRASDASCWSNGVPRYGVVVKLVGKSRIIWDIPQSNLRDIDLSAFEGSIDLDMVCFYKGFVCAPEAIIAIWREAMTEEVAEKDYHPPPGMNFYAEMAAHGYPRGAVAKTWANAGAGNWSTGTWSPAGQPAGGDAVTFDGTSTANCTVNVDVGANGGALASVTVAALYTGTVTLSSLPSLDAFGALTVNGGTVSSSVDGNVMRCTTFTLGGGVVAVGAGRFWRSSSTVSITAGTWTSGVLTSSSSGNINLSSSISLTEVMLRSSVSVTVTLGATLTVSTDISIFGDVTGVTTTLAVGTNTVNASGTANIGTSTIGNGTVTFSTGGWIAGGVVTVGRASGSTGSFGSNSAWTFTCNANLTVAATGTVSAPNVDTATAFTFSGSTFTMSGTYNANGGRLTFNSTGAQTFSPGSQTYNNFEMSNDLATITVSSSGTINGTTTIQPLRTLTVSAGATLTYASGSKLTKKGALNVNGTLTISKKATFIYRHPVLGSGVILLSSSCFIRHESELTPIIPPIIPIENFQPRVRLSG